MSDCRFDLSLRISTQTISLNEICRTVPILPFRMWEIGEPRKTPKGGLLDGFRKETYFCGKITNNDRNNLPEALEKALISLHECESLFRSIVEGNGRAEFFVGWYFAKNSGDVIGWGLMKKLSSLYLDLSLDIYFDSP